MMYTSRTDDDFDREPYVHVYADGSTERSSGIEDVSPDLVNVEYDPRTEFAPEGRSLPVNHLLVSFRAYWTLVKPQDSVTIQQFAKVWVVDVLPALVNEFPEEMFRHTIQVLDKIVKVQ